MGCYFFDQYSILHFSVGVVMYFWNISFITAFAIHLIFEIIENTKIGMNFINKYFIHPGYFSWPGGKNYSDSLINSIGDNVFFILGYIISYYADIYAVNNNWTRIL
tara:strand:- start:250 stop:567 length:318 start_codon:yes stop_codon:yes gene_type:complete